MVETTRLFNHRAQRSNRMPIANREYADAWVFMPAGKLSHENSDTFLSQLTVHIDECMKGRHAVVFDLSHLEYVSSSGLRCFMLAGKQIKTHKGRMMIASMQPVVTEIFQISRFNLMFEVFPTVREALASVSEQAALAFDRG